MADTPRGRNGDQEKLEPSTASAIEQHRKNAFPSQKTAMSRWRAKGKEKSTIALACTWIVDRQISIAATVLGLLFFTHLSFPQARHHTQKFFRISYYNPSTGTFALGWDDIFFVFYWIIVFTGLRCVVMDYILSPIAAHAGIGKKKARVRFVEQAWMFIYYAMFWGTGIYIMYNSDYWLNLHALWRNWPIREMGRLSKWYYLVQFAFWLQQIVVVNIEERRKDHWQMFTHHIITCALIFTSYGYHQTKVGTLILCLMDVVDFLFPLAKILKYLGFELACDVAFGVFMVTWFITRHVFYMWICWSIYAHIPQEIQYGCYSGSVQNLQGPFPTPNDYVHLTQPFRDPVGLVCWNNNIKWGFLAMLLALQCVLLVWFTMIIKVAYRVISGQGAEDSRSDDEDDEEEEEQEENGDESVESNEKRALIDNIHLCVELKPFLEKEVLSTDANLSFPSRAASQAKSPVRRSSRRKEGSGQSSSINVLAASDRKELLGRIGCDKSSTD